MLFRKPVLDRILRGEITLAFRRWRRPTVKAGGRLRTSTGELLIEDVRTIHPSEMTDREAQAAGFDDPASLLAALDGKGELYRIAVSYNGADGRESLRNDTALSDVALADLRNRLGRTDTRLGKPGWTLRALQLIADHPGRRAQELAEIIGMEKAVFKTEIRRFKELGLTESLDVGYRLSPRGLRFLTLVSAQ